MHIFHDPTTVLLGTKLKIIIIIPQKTCIRMWIVTLVTRAKHYKQSKCPLVEKQIKIYYVLLTQGNNM